MAKKVKKTAKKFSIREAALLGSAGIIVLAILMVLVKGMA